MPERFEIYSVYKSRYINTLPFPFLLFNRPHLYYIVFHCNYVSVLHRFRDIITYFTKIRHAT